LAWARLGVDPMEREARIVDGRAMDDAELAGPMLIAQCDSVLVLSDVKLALLEHLDAATPVTLLQRLGLPDERITTVPPAAPDRSGRSLPAYDALADELGDLLYQVVFQSLLAEEAGAFTVADVARGIHDKLVRRHPHVFGTVDADSTADVIRNWEQIKKQ